MGASESSTPNNLLSDTAAFRVVNLIPGSPADKAGIENQVDFIKYDQLNQIPFNEYLE